MKAGERLTDIRDKKAKRLRSGYRPPSDGGEYSDEEVAFILAMERWIKKTGRQFPTFTQVLAVAKSLGYRQIGACAVQGDDSVWFACY